MRRALLVLLSFVFVLGLAGCGEKAAPPAEKPWTEQDLMDMFSEKKAANEEALACALMPDRAYGLVGAVLLRNNDRGTSEVAFFDSDGHCQQAGTYAGMAAEPDFTYLGNGAVTFQLQADDGTIYGYTLTISLEDDHVHFRAVDELTK